MHFLCLVIQRGMPLTPLSFCVRVIVNEKPLNCIQCEMLLSMATPVYSVKCYCLWLPLYTV